MLLLSLIFIIETAETNKLFCSLKNKENLITISGKPFWSQFSLSLFFFFLINLFIFGCIGSSLLRTGFLSSCGERQGATLRCGVWASHCGGFSCCGARALGTWASVVVAHRLSSCGSQALERRLSSCGARA